MPEPRLTQQEWGDFLLHHYHNGHKPGCWPTGVKIVAARYRQHVGDSLLNGNIGSAIPVDDNFLLTVERECPVDDSFRKEFRTWISNIPDPLGGWRARSEAYDKELIINEAAARFLATVSVEQPTERIIPGPPLLFRKTHPFVNRVGNQVKIEIVPKADLTTGHILPVLTAEDVTKMKEHPPSVGGPYRLGKILLGYIEERMNGHGADEPIVVAEKDAAPETPPAGTTTWVELLALANLTEREKEIVHLRYGTKDKIPLSIGQVAWAMDTSEQAVRQELLAANKKLRAVAAKDEAASQLLQQAKVPLSDIVAVPLDPWDEFL